MSTLKTAKQTKNKITQFLSKIFFTRLSTNKKMQTANIHATFLEFSYFFVAFLHQEWYNIIVYII